MNSNSSFDAGQDRELGDALRELLTPGANAEFVARVLARLPAAGSSWDREGDRCCPVSRASGGGGVHRTHGKLRPREHRGKPDALARDRG